MINQLIQNLQKIYDEHGDLDLLGVVSSSGTAYELSQFAFVETVEEDDWEPREHFNLQVGEKYVRISLGN